MRRRLTMFFFSSSIPNIDLNNENMCEKNFQYLVKWKSFTSFRDHKMFLFCFQLPR